MWKTFFSFFQLLFPDCSPESLKPSIHAPSGVVKLFEPGIQRQITGRGKSSKQGEQKQGGTRSVDKICGQDLWTRSVDKICNSREPEHSRLSFQAQKYEKPTAALRPVTATSAGAKTAVPLSLSATKYAVCTHLPPTLLWVCCAWRPRSRGLHRPRKSTAR